MTLCKSVEFYEYVQVGPGRNTSRVTADSVALLELTSSPEGVLVDGRLFIPMSNVKCIELAEGAMLGKASSMLIRPTEPEKEVASNEQDTYGGPRHPSDRGEQGRRDGGRKARKEAQ